MADALSDPRFVPSRRPAFRVAESLHEGSSTIRYGEVQGFVLEGVGGHGGGHASH